MMEWTDRHCRYFHRILSPNSLLYTEMVTTGALLYGDRQRFLLRDDFEQSVALQLGGSDPAAMTMSAKFAQDAGFHEVNINVGCPSDRVQSGRIGACLMAEAELVAQCVAEMRAKVDIPITVKTRIGIDDEDSLQFLLDFVGTVSEAGCDTFIIHARKAILQGLSPKENRTIPPLNYPRVYQLKATFPELTVVLNGGVNSIDGIQQHLRLLDGVMIGREAYHNPFFLTQVEQQLFAQAPTTRLAVLERFIPYIERQLSLGVRLQNITRHILGLFAGQAGGKHWRRYLSDHARLKNAGPEVLLEAFDAMKPHNSDLDAGASSN
ncbi:tRNA dihydrouridine(20/20a) synthase DusA [Cycloclasticus sp. 46_120_T64]|nr:tRNA dihydrouridine(20/20a) synthase DusA [Cycloclasticus sp. 46_120_T64]